MPKIQLPSAALYDDRGAKGTIKRYYADFRRSPREALSKLWLPKLFQRLALFLLLLGAVTLIFFDLNKYKETGKSRLTEPWLLRQRPMVVLEQGAYKGGVMAKGPQLLEYWLGVPYAQHVGGENRFSNPKPLGKGVEERDSREWGRKCWGGFDSEHMTGGDDCLNMNIWRIKDTHGEGSEGKEGEEKKELYESKLVPVAVYFHGGGFNFGSAEERDMANIVAHSELPLIGITLNYRVGALGFLSGNLTAEAGILNLGLKDQWQALLWIQENIHHFGGDKDKVTIWGMSAGAHSVGHHLMKIDSERPFARTIMESGGPTARAVYPYNNNLHEEQLFQFLEAAGIVNLPRDQIIPKLRTLPIDRILKASEDVYFAYDGSLRWPWQPVIDGPGGMIPKAPLESWEKDEFRHVPILTGFNTDEGTLFISKSVDKSDDFDNFFKTLIPGLTFADLQELNELYPDPLKDPSSPYRETRTGYGLGSQYKRLSRAYGDFAYIAPVKHTAYFASAREGPLDAELYLYHFGSNQTVLEGAAHAAEAKYISYHPDVVKEGDMAEGIAVQMHSYFTSFVLSGDPCGVRLGRTNNRTPWVRYGKRGSSAVMNFGLHNDILAGGTTRGDLTLPKADLWGAEEARFWWRVAPLSER